MLSKCLNSHCSATFQYLGQGRLFRVDFADARKSRALAGKETVSSIRSKACPIEHFWLCNDCSATLTIELSDGGEVRLIPNEISERKPAAAAGIRGEGLRAEGFRAEVRRKEATAS